MGTRGKRNRLYVGVDVGGTKIQAALVEESGAIVARERSRTPRTGGKERALRVVIQTVARLLKGEGVARTNLAALGVAVPGVVDPKRGLVVVTPNMSLSGAKIVSRLKTKFRVPVVLGNDCNLGTLGESWLGAARGAKSAFGILVGTGIGGGIVQKRRIWRGARESAAEVGHIVMAVGGPVCGCGNRGCLEALASRTAIERDIRAAVRKGAKTVLTDLLDGNLRQIRSGALAQALKRKDRLVTGVMRRASEILGHACLTVRHLLDPEAIVLGGGVIEACGDFVFPIVTKVVESDRLPGAREGGRILASALGDDAVVLGAVALARESVGRSPFKKRYAMLPHYQPVHVTRNGRVTVGKSTYTEDVHIDAGGKATKRGAKGASGRKGKGRREIGPEDLEPACQGGPEVIFIGTGLTGRVRLSPRSAAYLRHRGIDCRAAPTPKAVRAYNRCKKRKAAIVLVSV